MPKHTHTRTTQGNTRTAAPSRSLLSRFTRPFSLPKKTAAPSSQSVIQRLDKDKLLEAEDPFEYVRKKVSKYSGRKYHPRTRKSKINELRKIINSREFRKKHDLDTQWWLDSYLGNLHEYHFGQSTVGRKAKDNKWKSRFMKGGKMAASGTNTVLDQGGVVGDVVSTGAGGLLSGVNFVRRGRQSDKAQERVVKISKFMKNLPEKPETWEDRRVREIAEYAKKKQTRRFKRLGIQSGFDATAMASAGMTVMSGGATSPVTLPIAVGAGIASTTMSLGTSSKGIYKEIRGTRGKHRKQKATLLLNLAMSGHEDSLKLLEALGILKKDENDETGHYTRKQIMRAPLADQKRIMQHIKQKMRS